MIDGCDWKLTHDNKIEGYAQILRNHNMLRHKNFEVVDDL
jgi:hypothetical protein